MKRHRLFFPLLVIFAISRAVVASPASADFQTDANGPVHPWTNLNFNTTPSHFNFAIFSDRNGGARAGVFENAVDKVNQLQPEFSICIGDLLPGYTEDPGTIEQMRAEMNGILGKLEMPFFYVPGNHDMSNAVMGKSYKAHLGRTYYHFLYKDTLFLILSTEENYQDKVPTSDLTDEETQYAEKILQDNPKVRWTFVFMHKPLWDVDTPLKNWSRVDNLLAKRHATVFAGHEHHYATYQRHGNEYIKLGTTGGANGQMGPVYGTFDEIVWVSMTDKAPRITNLALDGLLNTNMRTENQELLDTQLSKDGFVTPGPVFSTGDSFKSGQEELRLDNATAQPMKMHVEIADNELLRATPHQMDLVVNPKSSLTQAVTLEAARAVSLAKLPSLHCTVSAAIEDHGKDLPISKKTKTLAVESIERCPSLSKVVVLDGKLDEWGALPYSCAVVNEGQSLYQGPKDSTCRFATAYDAQNLYIAIQTTDDRRIAQPGKSPLNQDGILLELDARPEPERSEGQGLWAQRMKDHLAIQFCPGEKDGKANIFEPQTLPKGMQVKCVWQGKGMTAEVAIPVAWLNAQQKAEWKAFRLNLGVSDVDSPDSGANTRKLLMWRPRWLRADSNYAGSGTFEKQD